MPDPSPAGQGRTAVPAAVDALGGVLEVQLQALLGEAGVAAHDDRPLPAPAAAAACARRRQARDVEALRSAEPPATGPMLFWARAVSS